jgi:hypothetical protein
MNINRFSTIVISLGIFLSILNSCLKDNDFLKEHSYNFDDKTFYNTESDMEIGLNSCYATVQYLMLGNSHERHSWMLQGLGCDTFFHKNSFTEFSDWGKMNPDGGCTRHWFDYLYKLINRCNTIIDVIDERPQVAYSSTAKKNGLRGEAVFLRAWAYRCLAGMFGRVVILNHRTTKPLYNYIPDTRQDVWDFVRHDLIWAEQNLPKNPRKIGTVTKAAAATYLAEINIALGKFNEAVEAATRVIDKTDGDYQIMTTRFGSRKDEKKDRYGNELNPYWDLFRGKWGNIGNGKGREKAQIDNPNSSENKEAIWVCQYNYGTFEKGGSGDSWWRTHCSATETAWTPNILLGDQSVRVKKDGKKFYFYGNNIACFPKDIDAHISKKSDIPGATELNICNIPRDSTGSKIPNLGNFLIPVEYIYTKLYDDPHDFRGSETMMQKNFYTPGGSRWLDEKAAMYARQKAAIGTPDEETFKIFAKDTMFIFPRLWKFSDDFHPNGENKAYDVDWYMIRIPETYLLRAEAYLALGKKDKAAEDINVVRSRAGAAACSADDINIDYILDERTRELFGEEHRWITLNRLSVNPNCTYISDLYPVQNETTSNTMYERIRKYATGYENDKKTVRELRPDGIHHYSNFKPFNYLYPIPIQVIQSNSGAEYKQNTGY